MHPDDDRPIATTFFPWMRTGLVLGAACAALFAVLADDEDPVPVAAPDVVAAVVIDAPVVAPPPPFAPVDPPWPPLLANSTGRSTSNDSFSEEGIVVSSVAALEDFYESALASCAPTTITVGKTVSLLCENARDESRAIMIEKHSASSWLRTSRTKFELPSPRGGADAHAPEASCGWTMRFVALPASARFAGGGGGNDAGHCSFDVDGLPSVAWSTMLHNLFRPGTTIHKRQLDDGEITRWTAEGWDNGWWRVDVVSASAHAQRPAREQRARVELTRWTPGEPAWAPPVLLDQKIAALEGCWEPCSLALRSPAKELGPDVRAQMRAGDIIDRCLYECRGTEQAPAVLEPAARALRREPATGPMHTVVDLASEDSIP